MIFHCIVIRAAAISVSGERNLALFTPRHSHPAATADGIVRNSKFSRILRMSRIFRLSFLPSIDIRDAVKNYLADSFR